MNVMIARQELQEVYKYHEDFELLEHTGGAYSPDKLLSADFVFVVAEQEPLISDDKILVTVGRGVYSEVRQFLDEKMHDQHHKIFFCHFTDENTKFDIHQILGAKITNIDSWISYGKIMATTVKSNFPRP